MSERTVTAGRDTAGTGDTGGTGGTGGADVPVRLAAVFLPAPLPREGRVAFYDPEGGHDGEGLPGPSDASASHTDLTVVRPHGTGVRRRTAPALSL
ncbi:hypothetical protein B7767_36965, partial [Streptomyces sp. 13-12-16]|uniref:hypothetical protein n=1 Tax=Streptomyces sp. 13-12-16 TaxID=1570823 RepID=UPI000A222670